MKVSDLKVILQRFQAMFDAAGARRQAADLARLIGALDGYDAVSVDDFVDQMEALLAEDAPEPANDLSIRRHVNRLKEAALDRIAFDKAVADLRSDRRVRKAELDKIAFGYIGGRQSYPSKKAALEAIEGKFLERARNAKKKELIDKTTPW